MAKVALIIIYNHQFNANIDILERMYGNRFDDIYHLVPFYSGDKDNVIAVYDSSHYFQGYVAQGLKGFFQSHYTHYLFIADDLILNPAVNQDNYAKVFQLKDNSSFLPGFISLHDTTWWERVGDAYRYTIEVLGVEAKKQLPSYDVALKKLSDVGLEIKPLRFDQIWKKPITMKGWMKRLVTDRHYSIKSHLARKRYHLPYPLVGSYSDIFVVSSDVIKQFCHYCGVFASTKLFVEVALPTSLVLSTKEIVTEKQTSLKGGSLWTIEDYKILDNYGKNLKSLLASFPEGLLYLHPVKLSQWDSEL